MAPMTTMGGQGHVRSASQTSWQHPVVMDVEEQLLALRSWTSNPGQNALSLAHVRALLCVLDELLHLPLAQAALRRSSLLLLDGFLVLADAFGSFLAALLALRQHAADLRAAVRRRDPAKTASAARAQRELGKELEQLAAAARCARPATLPPQSDVVMRTVAEAINDTAVASASVFLEVGAVADAAAAMAVASPSSPPKKQMRLPLGSRTKLHNRAAGCCDVYEGDQLIKEAQALEKLHGLELCIGELESESEKVFRSLVQTRVSLLNIHTPTI